MTTKCPLCGCNTLEEKHGVYYFDPPPNITGGIIVVSDALWFSCSKCGEDILSSRLDRAIDKVVKERSDAH